jgi:hypothetical protein
MIRHIVYFTVKHNFDQVYNGLKILEDIPCDGCVHIRKNLKIDQINNDIDIVVYGEFKDEKALNEYKNHDLYKKSIDCVRPYRDIRLAVDIDMD